MSRIISVISGKGGVGKTTFALNLGAALSQHFKKSVTVVDCNLTASHLGLHLGMYYCPTTINKVLRKEISVVDSIHPHFSGLKVIPASISVHELKGVDISKLKDVVRDISEKNDLVILDASPGLGREAMSAIKASDELIYITTPHIPSIMDIIRCHEIAEEVNAKPLGVVVNMVGKDKYEMRKHEIEYFTGLPVISVIPYDKNVSKSLHNKVPITISHPKSPASKEIIKFASNLIGIEYKHERNIIEFIKSIFK
ncbi:MAG: cell division ATPase MinD [Candidatus Aenigmatarchaeota archaeon]